MDRAKAASREDKAAAGKETAVSRAVAEDDTALLLAAVGSFRKEGSDASRMLDQEMSTRLLHLACKHDAVQCARLLLEGGHGITASPVDARDQLTRTPLQVAAEAHSARCIELLLSKNARTDLKLVDGRPLLALEIALLSRRAQVKWSLDNSIEDLLSSLQEKDLNVVRLLAEKTREVGEVAYRYAMEGRVTVLAMLLLVAEEKISAPVSVVIEGVRTKKSIYYSIVDEALSIGDAPARDSNERRKALLSEIQLLNQFGAALWRDRNIDKRSLPPLLKAAKVGDVNVTKMLLMGDVDVNEADPEGNTALHWCLSGSSSTQEPRIVWLLLKNGARVFQGNKLGLTPVHSAAAKGNYKALQSLLLHAQDCVDTPSKTKETPLFLAVKNGSLDCVKLLLRSGASTKVQNLRKQRPIDVATSQDMHFILTSANVVPWNRSSHPKKIVTNKESCKEFLDDNFVDYDSDDLNESFTGLKTSASHRDFRSSNGSAQGGKSKNHCAPKQGSKFVPRPNHWLKHDYTRKIFVGGLPLSVGAEYLTEFFTAEFGPVEEAVVIGIRMGDRVQCDFLKLRRGLVLSEDAKEFIDDHVCFMNSYERGMLGIKLYKKLNSLSPGQKLKLLRALGKIAWDLSLMDDVDKLPLLCDIIVQAKAEGKPFPRTILGGFRLLRDYFAHIPEHQYDKATKPWKRKFRIYIGIELMIPVHLKKLLPRIIKCFLDAKIDIKRELLSSHTMRCSICYSAGTSSTVPRFSATPETRQTAGGITKSINELGTSSKAVASSTTPQTGHATKGTIGTSNELGTSSKAVGSSTTPQTGQDTKRTTRSSNELGTLSTAVGFSTTPQTGQPTKGTIRSSNELVETSSTAQRNTWSTGQAARNLFAHSSGAPSAVQQQSQDDWETVQKRKGKKRISK